MLIKANIPTYKVKFMKPYLIKNWQNGGSIPDHNYLQRKYYPELAIEYKEQLKL